MLKSSKHICMQFTILIQDPDYDYSVLVRNTCQHSQQTRRWPDAGPKSPTLAQHQSSTGSTPCVCWAAFNPVNTKHLYKVVPTLYEYYTNVLCLLRTAAAGLVLLAAYCWPRLQADTHPMSVKCWASVAGVGQYPFCPSQYFILPYLHAGGIVQSRCFEPKPVNVGPPPVKLAHIQRCAKQDTVTQYWAYVGSPSQTVGQH